MFTEPLNTGTYTNVPFFQETFSGQAQGEFKADLLQLAVFHLAFHYPAPGFALVYTDSQDVLNVFNTVFEGNVSSVQNKMSSQIFYGTTA